MEFVQKSIIPCCFVDIPIEREKGLILNGVNEWVEFAFFKSEQKPFDFDALQEDPVAVFWE